MADYAYPGYMGVPISMTVTKSGESAITVEGIISGTPPAPQANVSTFVPASGASAGVEQARATHLRVNDTTITAHCDKTTYVALAALAGDSQLALAATYGPEALTYAGTGVVNVEPQEFSAAIAEVRIHVHWDGGLTVA